MQRHPPGIPSWFILYLELDLLATKIGLLCFHIIKTAVHLLSKKMFTSNIQARLGVFSADAFAEEEETRENLPGSSGARVLFLPS